MTRMEDEAMEQWTEEGVERVLEWYEKDPGELLVGEEVLEDVSLETLREIFSPEMNEDPYMKLVYEVEEADVEKLQPLVIHRIDLSKYDYFVAAFEDAD